MKKAIFFSLGTIFLVIGFLGVFLPIIPTVPFLLLTLHFYTLSSKRIQQKFINSKIYKKYLSSYMKTKKLSRKTKIKILIYASIMIGIAIIKNNNIWVRIFLVIIIMMLYAVFIFKINTLHNKEDNS